MKSTVTPPRYGCLLTLILLASLTGGCASPPSVVPLLRVTEHALINEAARLNNDAARDSAHIRQTLRSLQDAYDQDLSQTNELTAGWVREATGVYVAAREAVVRHELVLAQERQAREDNLRSAAAATRRAINLIEQQDKLLNSVAGEDLRRLLYGDPQILREPVR